MVKVIIVAFVLAVAFIVWKILSRPMSREQFMAVVRARIEWEHPNVQIKAEEDFGWTCDVNGNEITVYLDNLYVKYLQYPGRLDETVGYYLRSLSTVQPERAKTWEEVKRCLLPSLKPDDYVQSISQMKGGEELASHLVMFDHIKGLTVLVAIDEEFSMSFVTTDNLEKWQVSKDELFACALNNLASLTAPLWEDACREAKEKGLFVFAAADGYDAARLLLPDLHERVSRALECDRIAVVVPNRDFLAAVSADKKDVVQKIQKLAEKDFQQRDYPVSPRLFLFPAE